MGFGLVIRFIELLQNVTTNNCDSLAELHTPKITVTTTHINSSQTSLVMSNGRCYLSSGFPNCPWPHLPVCLLTAAALLTDSTTARVECYVMTYFFYYCQTVAGLLMWGALSDERTGLSFTIAAGPRQRSHS
jgi:hypothetical protein